MNFLIKHRGLQIISLALIYFLIAPFFSLTLSLYLFSLSSLIKEILMWIIPITVFFFISASIVSFKKSAPLFIGCLFLFEGLSNFLSVIYTFVCARLIEPIFSNATFDLASSSTLIPIWHLPIQKPWFWAADKGAFLGFIVGLIFSFSFLEKRRGFIYKGKIYSEIIFIRFFSKIIPLFVVGCIAKMHATNAFNGIGSESYFVIFWVILFALIYVFCLFLFGNGGSLQKTSSAIYSLLGAGFSAFSSGCSLSTMPLTIEGTKKTLKEPSSAELIIPATTNIQQIGDCIINSFLCFILYRLFFHTSPSLLLWLNFSLLFTCARYATAAVMGGAIFLMLPIYERCFNFSHEMISIILALNVLLDPFVTSINVMANGALCKIFENFWLKFRKKSTI